jgi:hypothetical protein
MSRCSLASMPPTLLLAHESRTVVLRPRLFALMDSQGTRMFVSKGLLIRCRCVMDALQLKQFSTSGTRIKERRRER